MELALNGHRMWDESPFPSAVWLAALAVCLGAGLAAVWWGWIWAFTPIFVAMALLCVLRPIWGLYPLVCTFFFPYEIVSGIRAYPADVILFLVVIGFWLRRAREGRLGLVRTPVDLPIVLWLGVMALSLVNAVDLSRGLVNWLRHIQLLLLFYAVAGMVDERHSRGLIILLAILSAAFSAFNVIPFVESGGRERVFGVAHVVMSGILTISIVYLTARICLEPSGARRRLFIILLVTAVFGQTATQSRGALGVTFIGFLIAIGGAWWWARRNRAHDVKRRTAFLLIAAVVFALVLLIIAAPLTQTLVGRFAGVGNASSTMAFRYFMWRSALRAFLDYPILGIGLGQVQVWDDLFPSMRLDPLGRLTFGLGTHNELLKYLAETGLLGIVPYLWFYLRLVRLGKRTLLSSQSRRQAAHLAGLWGAAMTIIFRSFIEGHAFYAISGITTVLLFGLLVGHFLRAAPSLDRGLTSEFTA